MAEPDATLLVRFRRGDKRAFGDIYDQYSPALYGVVLRVVRDKTLAQDVLQESFLKVWNHVGDFDPERGTIFTWLLNIARNTAIDKIRSAGYRKKRGSRQIPLDEQGHPFTASPTFEPDHIGIKSILDNQLEDKYRRIIDLLYFEGMTQQEVQEYLGIPLGTVKSRTRIALRELRKVFETQYINLALWIYFFFL